MSLRQKEQACTGNERQSKLMQQARQIYHSVLSSWGVYTAGPWGAGGEISAFTCLLREVSTPSCLLCSCQHWFAAFHGICTINTFASFQNSLSGLHCKQCCSLMFPASILVALQNLQQTPFSGILSPSDPLLSTHRGWKGFGSKIICSVAWEKAEK